jgi:hypothetical protein
VDLSAAKMFGMDATSRELAGDYPECSFKKLAKLSLKGNGCAQIDKALREADDIGGALVAGRAVYRYALL